MKKLFLLIISTVLFIVTGSFIKPVVALSPTIVPQSYEHISNYEVIIDVQEDSSFIVDETIRVYAAGNQIKRGIYREFPTQYTGKLGLKDATTFEIISVERDGKPAQHQLINKQNGKRLEIMDPNIFLNKGFYVYHIKYRTMNQMRFAGADTEVYYNAIGTDWAFSIDFASVQVLLPSKFLKEQLEINGYSGKQDEKLQNFTYTTESLGNQTKILFTTKKTLASGEGLTVSVIFPTTKAINPPGFIAQIGLFFEANLGFVLISMITFVSLIVAFLLWFIKGRDPRKGVIIPLFSPPKDLSPADVRFLYNMGFDSKTITAIITYMAVKGYIKIIEKEGEYSIKKINIKMEELSAEEKLIAKLFRGYGNTDLEEVLDLLKDNPRADEILGPGQLEKLSAKFSTSKGGIFRFSKASSSKIIALNKNFKKLLKEKFEKIHFVNNRLYAIVNGVLLAFTLLLYAIFYGLTTGSSQSEPTFF